MRYIDQTFFGPSPQPVHRHELARMDQILAIIDAYLFRSWSGGIAFERMVAEGLLGRSPDIDQIAEAVPVASGCAAALAKILAGPNLIGPTYSLADIRQARLRIDRKSRAPWCAVTIGRILRKALLTAQSTGAHGGGWFDPNNAFDQGLASRCLCFDRKERRPALQ